MDPPIAKSGGNIITQPGRPVLLSGIASLVLLEDHIIKYQWSLQEGNSDVVIEVTPGESRVFFLFVCFWDSCYCCTQFFRWLVSTVIW